MPVDPVAAEPAGLRADLERVRAELAAMRRVELVQATDPARLARFEVRLGQLEEELRRLTGRVERLEFDQRQVEQRIDRLVEDLDQRLRALEGTAPAPPTTARPAPTPAPVAAATPGPATPPAAQGEQTLGRIPESALQGLPRPEPSAVTPPPKTTALPPKQQYDAAMQLLRAGDYAGAEAGLQLFLELNPDHPLASNAAYWLAETYYVRKNYPAAAAAFARNYRTYGKKAPKAADNLLKLGMSLRGLGEKDKACLTYAQLAKEFPDAPAHIKQALARERSRTGCP